MRTAADLNRIIDKIAENTPAPHRAEVPQTSADRRKKGSGDPNATPTPRSFVPRLAAESDSLAPTRSARPRRQTPDSSLPRFAPLRSADQRVKDEKIGKNVKPSGAHSEKRASKEVDEETKRTQRRRQIDPTTCERDYSTDEIEFMKALDDYKRASGRMFPTCSEILEVFKSLGYVKTARAETSDEPPKRNVQPNRAATPAFLSDEENDAFEFDAAPVLEIA